MHPTTLHNYYLFECRPDAEHVVECRGPFFSSQMHPHAIHARSNYGQRRLSLWLKSVVTTYSKKHSVKHQHHLCQDGPQAAGAVENQAIFQTRK
jgi:hypothetical protein